MRSTDALFDPIQIRNVTLKNRVILTSMGGTNPFNETEHGYAFKPEIRDYYMDRVRGGVALIIGSEGSGISRLTEEHCDRRVSLPMKGQLDSLNASVAAGVVMYRVLSGRKA